MKMPSCNNDQSSVSLCVMHHVEMGWETIILICNLIICFGVGGKGVKSKCLVGAWEKGERKPMCSALGCISKLFLPEELTCIDNFTQKL